MPTFPVFNTINRLRFQPETTLLQKKRNKKSFAHTKQFCSVYIKMLMNVNMSENISRHRQEVFKRTPDIH